ncbi:hypothetical protein [Hugenholtzia roseola]|uniref:hypothetical protein n=1 Tax=Hugenholtzia roseola TaxID=1002 RepID=UPI000412DA49|nr:hypothetical protein [Hugenholtzia roseola]
MAQYIPFDSKVEVLGEAVLSFINGMGTYADLMRKILAEEGIAEVRSQSWYPQAAWLSAFHRIGEKFGSNTLFAIGKAIPESAIFPKEINDLESALHSIGIAYQMNHRNGEIGYYKLAAYNADLKIAIMECKNPYPSEFDRGIITSMARRFKPEGAFLMKVELDPNLPSRLHGAESCTYRISW